MKFLIKFAHEFYTNEQRYPNADDIAVIMNAGKREEPEEQGAMIISDLSEFFSGKRPEELKAKQFQALRKRWGFKDRTLYTLKSIAEEYDLVLEDFLEVEITLINRLGWVVSLNKQAKKKWLAS